jgi:co-chaperonin GroES (HSP10)
MSSTIAMPGNVYKNEGLVIGVGPGIAADGQRVPSQFEIGDRVYFSSKHIHIALEQDSDFYDGFYHDSDVFILIERNVICKLPPIPFEVV